MVQPDEQAGGGEFFGLAVMGEVIAEFREHRQSLLAFALCLVLEDEGEGFGGASGPVTGEEAGDLKQRLEEILAAGIELNSGRKVFEVKRGSRFQFLQVLLAPEGEPQTERLCFSFDSFGAEILELDRHGEAFEVYGDGALGQVFRQEADAGEGLGREEGAFTLAVSVAEAALEAAFEDGAEDGILAATAGADGGMTLVEEEGGTLLGVVDAAAEVVGGDAGGEGGIGTEEAEQLQAAGLAGLFFGGVDGEVGSEVEGGEAVGVEDPEGEEVALVVGAMEVGAYEADDFIQSFGGLLIFEF